MRRWRMGLALVAVAAVSGCATLARQAFANPVVAVKEVRVKGVGMQGGSLDLILDVYNPNEYRLDASRITYQVWVDSNQIATGEIEKLATLTDKGNSEVVVPVNFTFASVQKALKRCRAYLPSNSRSSRSPLISKISIETCPRSSMIKSVIASKGRLPIK